MEIKSLLQLMVGRNASDLFLSVGTDVGIKIEGLVSPVEGTKLLSGQVKEHAYSIMTPSQIHTFEDEMELDFSLQLDGIGRFRINVFRERNEVAMVIRCINETVPGIEELGLPEVLKKLIMAPRGLILVVGPTGSGKSTSLASMIDYRNSNKTGHILTIEDPIEYLHSHKKSIINQREEGQDTRSY
jgi:twitching motility protein PilU